MAYPALPYGKMVILRHRTLSGHDEYGNDKFTFVDSQVGPCSVQQGQTGEELAYTDRVTTNITVYVPWGTDITFLDTIIVDDVEYEVDGDPASWKSPFTDHTAPIRVSGHLVKGASP